MWIFLNNAFVSIVDERAKKSGKKNARPLYGDMLVVRARKQGDIQRAFGKEVKVERTEGTDYRFRARLPRQVVANTIAQHVSAIDYGNFKDSVGQSDHQRHAAYSRVWGVMLDLQPPRMDARQRSLPAFR